jgi:hypothetical protein
MTDANELLTRQAQWQRSRRSLSWPEKIREAERLRPSLEAFRRMRMARGVTSAGQQQLATSAPPEQIPGHRAPNASDGG